jgi:response regulator of citrate/malate metabolism
MIAAGQLPGMGADDVTVVTGEPEPEDIPSVVGVLTKGRGNLYEEMSQIMDRAVADASKPITEKPTRKAKPVSVVIAEDDGWQRGMLEDALEHKKNVHFASTITEAVKKTEALQTLGHHVLLMLDNRIPFGDSLPENHPVEREFTRRLYDPYFQLGIGLANWIAGGNMPGIAAKDIAVLSAGDFEDLATDVKTISKNRSNYYRDLASMIDSACANGSFAERATSNTPTESQEHPVVILLDDDEQVHALAQRQFSTLFPNAELKLAKTPEEARQLAEQSENGPALFLFDEQLAAGHGKGSEAIVKMWPSFPDSQFAVVTSSSDLIAAGAVNTDNDCLAPVYSKNELATLAAPRNNLFAFIKSTLDYSGQRRGDIPPLSLSI